MSKKVSYLITDQNITVNYDGQTHIVPRSAGLSERLIKAVREQNLDEIPNLISTAKRVESFSKGKFLVKDGQILVNGVPAPKVLGDKIVKFANEGLPYQPLVKFAQNLQANPSYRAVNELFEFLEKNDHPITENGNFIAYKRVRADFKDIYTGTFDNSPGQLVEVPRNMVDEDSSKTCSNGLHVANWNYAHTQYSSANFSEDVMLEVEVNPADVVAIPSDYNQSKMRVCRYLVLGVIDSEHSSDVSYRVIDSAVNDRFDTDESCDHCEGCTDCDEEDDCEGCLDCEEDEEDDYPWETELDV